MKKWIIFFCVYLFVSCNFHETLIQNEDKIEQNLLSRSISPMISPVFEWWDTTSISLLGINSPVTLPWYNGASTQIPSYMLHNYRPEDGWEMVYNYCINTSPGEIGKNYIIFYNKLTGILRVFYYNNNNVTSASTTFWGINVSQTTSLLNAAGGFSLPMSIRFNNPTIYVTNLTSVPSKSVSLGWNCFDIELAYDDKLNNKETHFNIGIYNVNKENLKLDGDIQLETDGTIVTHLPSQYPGWVNNTSKTVGSSAKDYVGKLLKKTSLGKTATNIITGGVSSLVSSGAKWFLSSLVGKRDNTYNSDVQLTTKGTVNISGNIESLNTPNILPLANNPLPGCVKNSNDSFLPSYDKPLGVWGVEKLPKIHVYPKTLWGLSNNTPHSQYNKYELYNFHQEELYYFYPDSLKIKINPAVLELIEHYDTEIRCIFEGKNKNPQYYNPFCLNDFSPNENWCYGMKGSDEQFYTDTSIMVFDGPLHLWGKIGYIRGFVSCGTEGWGGLTERQFYDLYDGILGHPPIIPGIPVSTGTPGMRSGKFHYKVTITLYPKSPYDTTPIVLMRTFLPEYDYGNDIHCQLTGWMTRRDHFRF
ncbi:MAG: hypothetical protein ACLTZT_04135 [Butyricimonas faecalis]|uniref:hypothetical protein n=1 Tax=Butyricimonas faecalis TaxID=2093856 RepID=UPI001E08CA92|nr:hypothetical protein [Sanguibacteroides justesenii]